MNINQGSEVKIPLKGLLLLAGGLGVFQGIITLVGGFLICHDRNSDVLFYLLFF